MKLWMSRPINVEPTCIYLQVQYIYVHRRHHRILFKPTLGLAFLIGKIEPEVSFMLKLALFLFALLLGFIGIFVLIKASSLQQLFSLKNKLGLSIYAAIFLILCLVINWATLSDQIQIALGVVFIAILLSLSLMPILYFMLSRKL